MTPFKRLFSPLQLGPLALRNRIMMAPHRVSFMAGHGDAVQRVIDYHVERAKGGAALLVMSNFVVSRSWLEQGAWGGALKTSALGGLSLANDTASIPAYRRLVTRVHEHGAAFISQLNAGGRQHFVTGTQEFGVPLYAPSALPCPRTRQIPKAMNQQDLRELIASFVEATINLREAVENAISDLPPR